MTDEFNELGEPKNPEWVIKHCINKLVTSRRFIAKVELLIKEGEASGELDWSIHKWDESVGEDYEVEPYEGFMAYVGPGEHGFVEVEEFEAYCSETELNDYLLEAMEWYCKKNPEQVDEVEKLKHLLSPLSH
jgi:hypothetical protein